jgi:hypothetical protein
MLMKICVTWAWALEKKIVFPQYLNQNRLLQSKVQKNEIVSGAHVERRKTKANSIVTARKLR